MVPGLLSIGEVARRTGLSVSAIRFYEDRGLVEAHRTGGNQRRFARADLRRLAFIQVTQSLGFSLADIAAALATLPPGRAPTKADWTRLAGGFRAELDRRIGAMERLRDRLDGCIGCGCLSLDACRLYNADDALGDAGAGPRLLS